MAAAPSAGGRVSPVREAEIAFAATMAKRDFKAFAEFDRGRSSEQARSAHANQSSSGSCSNTRFKPPPQPWLIVLK